MGRDTNTDNQTFAQFIQGRRWALNLTLRQMEELTGIGNARLSRWERGIQRPDSADLLPDLAKALEVPVGELCRRAGGDLADSLPCVSPYLHTKYGQHLPQEALDELVLHCQAVLNNHGVTINAAAPV